MNIIKASKENVHVVTKLALMLWPEHSYQELYDDFAKMLGENDSAIFLASENNEFIGFSQCQLRFDYVEGTKSSPVGYLEGIYILENYRRMGVGQKLVTECEQWSKAKGCTEFGSAVELNNIESYHFHVSLGFKEYRIICFAKRI